MNDAVRGETVADYKRLLQTVCDNRPSGTRGRLAVAPAPIVPSCRNWSTRPM